jgi:DNA-binding HxlR family transcriptional regulator
MKNHTTQPCSDFEKNINGLHDEIRKSLAIFGGKWKLEIMWLLNQRMHRFNELRRAIPGVTQHMLTMQLRELESDGLVRRTIYAEIPPRVEYEITDDAMRLRPVFEAILEFMRGRTPGASSKVA